MPLNYGFSINIACLKGNLRLATCLQSRLFQEIIRNSRSGLKGKMETLEIRTGSRPWRGHRQQWGRRWGSR